MNHIKPLILAFAIITILNTGSSAQESRFPFEVSIGGGAATLYGDLDQHKLGVGGLLRFAYRTNKWLSVGFEAQHGLLRTRNKDYSLSSLNTFYTAVLDARVRPIPFFNPQFHEFHKGRTIPAFIESLYIGAGGGMTFNYQIRQRQTEQDSSLAFVIPVNVGFEIPLTRNYYVNKQLFFLNINAQGVFSTGDDMDGYSTLVEENKRNDFYTFYSISLIMKL